MKFLEASRSGSVTHQEFVEYWTGWHLDLRHRRDTDHSSWRCWQPCPGRRHAEMLELLVDSDADLLSATCAKP